MAAELVLFFNQQDLRPRSCGRERSSHPRGTASGDEDVGVGVALVKVPVGRFWRDHTARGETPQHPPVQGPQPAGLDEGLVIEAGGEKAAEGPVGRLHVVLERGPDPLWTNGHARLYAPVGAPDVRLVTDLHHATWVQEARR